jgi:hypothetical protein
MDDLNELIIPADRIDSPFLQDYSTDSEDGKVKAYFRDLETHLIQHISKADLIVGCVAWLTNERILTALSKKGVAIVVQKEDFLRPDIKSSFGWKAKLHRLYNSLHCPFERYLFPWPLSSMSVACDPSIDGVRCVGNYNSTKHSAFPRAHHKFVVFCNTVTEYHSEPVIYSPEELEFRQEHGLKITEGEMYTYRHTDIFPYAVWTGSFNFTANGTQSLENALVISDEKIVEAYYKEWSQIEAISEPLNWEHEWSAPEWRIGT